MYFNHDKYYIKIALLLFWILILLTISGVNASVGTISSVLNHQKEMRFYDSDVSSAKDLESQGAGNWIVNSPLFNKITSKNFKNISESDHFYLNLKNKLFSLLHHMDGIDNTFLNLTQTKNRSVSHRYTRSTTCSVTYSAVIELKVNVNSLLSNISGTQENTYCSIGSKALNRCIQSISLMQCGLKVFKDKFTNEIEKLDSYDKIDKWKDYFNRLSEEYMHFIDLGVLSEFDVELNKIQSSLHDLKNNLYAVQYDFKEKVKNLCIVEIIKGNSEKARDHFLKLKNSMLSQIIRTCYSDYGKLSQFYNIVNFVQKLPKCEQDRIAYSSLFNVMYENNALNSSEVIELYHVVLICMKISPLEKSIKPYVEQVIESWVQSIRQKDYRHIVSFGKKHLSVFQPYVKRLIGSAYDPVNDNIEDILGFIKDLPDISNDCVAFASLINALKANNKFYSSKDFMVAWRVKESMEYDNYKNIDEECKKQFESIKESFSHTVKGIIWNGNNCTIKNDCYNEYLYAAGDDFTHSPGRRRVFTWTNGTKVREAYWQFETGNNGKDVYIKNNFWNEYFYAASDPFAYDSKRRRVFTWSDKVRVSQGHWFLEPIDGNKLLIKNTVHHNYLFADFDLKWNSDMRYVFTWRPTEIPNSVMEEMKWIIEC